MPCETSFVLQNSSFRKSYIKYISVLDLHKLLGQTFQFHLSFENSLCEDYVTEKFFNAMGSGMIPVVLNGANMSRIAPTHSYIDVKDFTTIRGNLKFCIQPNSV
jgi:hypothetical protein